MKRSRQFPRTHGQWLAECRPSEARTKLAPLSQCPLMMPPGGRGGPKRSCGPRSHIHAGPSADPGKQGLETAPSPTCRGHLQSGPGTGTSDKNMARALNKGSQAGPAREAIQSPLSPRQQDMGPGRSWHDPESSQGSQGPRTQQRLDSQRRMGSLPPLKPQKTQIPAKREGSGGHSIKALPVGQACGALHTVI